MCDFVLQGFDPVVAVSLGHVPCRAAFRLSAASTSMTWPNWSTARYR